jgi:hypothetical protein
MPQFAHTLDSLLRSGDSNFGAIPPRVSQNASSCPGVAHLRLRMPVSKEHRLYAQTRVVNEGAKNHIEDDLREMKKAKESMGNC